MFIYSSAHEQLRWQFPNVNHAEIQEESWFFPETSVPEGGRRELVEDGGVAGGVIVVAVPLRPHSQVVPVQGV